MPKYEVRVRFTKTLIVKADDSGSAGNYALINTDAWPVVFGSENAEIVSLIEVANA